MKFGDFNTISEKIWNQSISKALKLEDLSQFESKKYQDIELPSFNFPETNLTHQEPLICGSEQWMIGTTINEIASNINASILDALTHGAEAIQPRIKKEEDKEKDLKEILNEVFLSMIYTDLSYVSSDRALADYLSLSKDAKKSVLKGAINIEDLSANMQSKAMELENFHLMSIESKAESVTAELAELTKNLKAVLTKVKENHIHLSQIRVVTSVGVYLPANVAKLRAIRLLWANLLKANELDFSSLFIVAHTSISDDSTPENKLIENTSATINAVLGTANLIFGGDFGEDSGRLHQNIQHILKMEANLHRVTDPLSGSFAIEKLTTTLAENAWNSQVV